MHNCAKRKNRCSPSLDDIMNQSEVTTVVLRTSFKDCLWRRWGDFSWCIVFGEHSVKNLKKLCKNYWISFDCQKMLLQRGYEIQTSLDFEWLKRGWVANGLDFKRDLKSRSPTIWNADKWSPFCPKPLEIRTKMSRFWMGQFSNGWDYSYCHSLSTAIWKPDHLKSNLQKVQISSVSGFQIPSVYNFNRKGRRVGFKADLKDCHYCLQSKIDILTCPGCWGLGPWWIIRCGFWCWGGVWNEKKTFRIWHSSTVMVWYRAFEY